MSSYRPWNVLVRIEDNNTLKFDILVSVLFQKSKTSERQKAKVRNDIRVMMKKRFQNDNRE